MISTQQMMIEAKASYYQVGNCVVITIHNPKNPSIPTGRDIESPLYYWFLSLLFLLWLRFVL